MDDLAPGATADLRSDDCYLAMKTHDARFDGSFFTAVTSTGIYCRPVCRVKLPRRENCRFYRHAAQAEAAGFRPCLRCRPELAPRPGRWSTEDASRVLATQAARLLEEPDAWGDETPGAARLAARLGVSDRHLRRIFEAQFGVSPLQYLQTQRLLAAKQMIADTQLPMTQVALASGFASVRRFNAAFVAQYGLNPSALRRAAPVAATAAGAGSSSSSGLGTSTGASIGKTATTAPAETAAPVVHGDHGLDRGAVRVRLGFRPPYDAAAMLGFFARRALNGAECALDVAAAGSVDVAGCPGGAPGAGFAAGSARPSFARTVRVRQGGRERTGWLHMQFDVAREQVLLRVSDSLAPVLPVVISRVRAMLDLDADPMAINAVLHDAFPHGDGLRVPGTVDGFELAIRAVLGQQVTVAAARTIGSRLVQALGEPIATPIAGLERLFPTPEAIASASGDALGRLGIVRTRQQAMHALAGAVSEGQLALHAGADREATLLALQALPGIGDWTAQYIAMRALRWPDAFPAGDVALQKALGVGNARAAAEASKPWRPWRSYAVLRAWHAPVALATSTPTPARTTSPTRPPSTAATNIPERHAS